MSNVIIPSSPEDKKRIKDCVIEISNAKSMMDAQRDFIKEAINSCAEDVEIDKKHINALAKIYHKQSFATFQQQKEEIEDLYESIVK